MEGGGVRGGFWEDVGDDTVLVEGVGGHGGAGAEGRGEALGGERPRGGVGGVGGEGGALSAGGGERLHAAIPDHRRFVVRVASRDAS